MVFKHSTNAQIQVNVIGNHPNVKYGTPDIGPQNEQLQS